MGAFSPTYEGVIEVAAVPDDFSDRMARRVQTGLLSPGSRRRADYVVRSQSRDAISFAARGFWTAYAIGLNEVELRRESLQRIAYHGSFRRWATYAAIHGLLLSVFVLAAVVVWSDGRRELAQTTYGWPLFLGLLAFFGLVWPWLLVAMHRRIVPRSLERIVREVVAG
ncbi:MAG TPA: hypothetical protein VJR46_02765 [Candidatus Dormibacteraeota bacterium]|nr:hypothetical protein [Candidatus Dormibacteraeota bacterium]